MQALTQTLSTIKNQNCLKSTWASSSCAQPISKDQPTTGQHSGAGINVLITRVHNAALSNVQIFFSKNVCDLQHDNGDGTWFKGFAFFYGFSLDNTGQSILALVSLEMCACVRA